MKFIVLAIKDIYKFICGRRSVFILIVVGLVFTNIGISFYYGYFMRKYNNDVSYYNKVKKYEFINNGNMDNDGICKLIELLQNNTCLPQITVIIATEDIISKSRVIEMPEYAGTSPIGKYTRLSGEVLNGRYFNNTEISKGLNVAIVTVSTLMEEDRPVTNGDFIDIKGNQYKIVGQILYSEIPYGSVIPMNTYIRNGYKMNYLRAEFADKLTDKQEKYLVDTINNNYTDVKLILPPEKDYEALNFFWKHFYQILCLFILAVVNIFSLIYYWISTNARKYSIFIICGCYKLKVFLLILTESLIISVGCFMIGNIIIYMFQNMFIKFEIFTTLHV